MNAPWQPLLDWWFGDAESPNEVAAQQGKLWFGKRDSQDLEARERFGVFVDQALAGELIELFAHRNAILERESSAEELMFLGQPGSSF